MGAIVNFLRSEHSLLQIEEALVKNHGDMTSACRELGLHLLAVEAWRKDDPEVADRIRTAQMLGWSTIESEVYRRAVIGVEEDVYFQGTVVGQKTVYSDVLLKELMKARVEAYKTEQAAPTVNVNVEIMPRADNYEAWIQMRKQALDGGVIEDQRSKPVPEVFKQAMLPVDAEFEPVSALKDIL